MSSGAIHLLDMSFGFGDVSLFANLTCSVPLQGLTVITGPNGSGKTTLCRMLCGLEKRYTGSIIIQGEEASDAANLPERILYHKQEPEGNLVAATAREDLAMWMHMYRGKEVDIAAIEAAARHFAIHDLLNEPTWELSGGQRKRIGLAALLLHHQRYWLLDEPSTGLDEANQQRLLTAIQLHLAQGGGALIITHNPHLYSTLAPQMYTIQNQTLVPQ